MYSFRSRVRYSEVDTGQSLSLTAMIIRSALPDTLPLFVPEVADETGDFQLDAIVVIFEIL